LSLFIGASFVLGLFTARTLLTSWGAQASITLYLDPATPDAEARALAQEIRQRDLLVRYVDRDAALKRLRADLGELAGALDGLTHNPLPPSLEVTPRQPLAGPALRVLAGELAQSRGVRDVEFGREWLDKLEALGRGLRVFAAGALVAVLGAALLVVANTIRLAVYARRDEIEIMKLVGASDWFVRWPFILEGMLVGALGAVVSLAVLFAAAGPVTSVMMSFLDVLPVSFGRDFARELVLSVFGVALLVGAGGATLSVRTHLAK
jgi:cell division transport system permease protein